MKSKKLYDELCIVMHKIARINEFIFTNGEYTQFLSLCTNDITILEYIDTHKSITAKQISDALNIPKTTIVSAVARLIKKGYLYREQNPNDKREQFLYLTKTGKQANDEHHQYERLFIEELMKLIKPEDYEEMAKILERGQNALL